LILAIVVLFSYILWRLLIRRNEILQKQQQPLKENFTPIADPVTIGNLNINALTKTNGITNPNTAKQLKQFVIKASYHTCYDGADLSASMVGYALSRGYRWLDFCTENGTTICYTTDDTLNGKATTSEEVKFEDIGKYISNGFISSDAPNSGDPLFIQFRPLWTPDNTANNEILKSSISRFNEYQLPIYKGTLNETTTIDQLMGKIVFVIYQPNNNNPINSVGDIPILNANNNTSMTTQSMNNISQLQAPLPLTIADGFTTSPPNKIYQILPTGSTANSDVYSTIQRIGSQITPMCIWSNDTHLTNYESIFNNSRAGIVPLSTVLKYTKENDPNVISSNYPGAFAGK